MTTPTRTADTHPTVGTEPAHSRWIWFAIFGAPAAWSIQILVNYPIAAHFCYPGRAPLSKSDVGGVWAVLIAVNVLMLLVALAAGATGISRWRTARARDAGPHDPVLESGTGIVRFMAYSGILVSGLFVIAIIMSALPLFIVPVCSYGA
jgi:hypothetical protein